jgi:hypothetical protein
MSIILTHSTHLLFYCTEEIDLLGLEGEEGDSEELSIPYILYFLRRFHEFSLSLKTNQINMFSFFVPNPFERHGGFN